MVTRLPPARTRGVSLLFSVPLLQSRPPVGRGFTRLVEDVIQSRRRNSPSVMQSNKGGWQSERTLQTWNSPVVSQLLTLINSAVTQMTTLCSDKDLAETLKDSWKIEAWANVNERHHYNGVHNHEGAVWSGVYYVRAKAGAAGSQAGAISFRNPSLAPLAISNAGAPQAVCGFFPPSISVLPTNGLLLAFPSWVEHYVHPHEDDQPRISIAWDAHCQHRRI